MPNRVVMDEGNVGKYCTGPDTRHHTTLCSNAASCAVTTWGRAVQYNIATKISGEKSARSVTLPEYETELSRLLTRQSAEHARKRLKCWTIE